MWMNGSRSVRSTPANARRTGNPSPSVPDGAVVIDRTGRARVSSALGATKRGSESVSAVMAGMRTSEDIIAADSLRSQQSTAECGRLFPLARAVDDAEIGAVD